jgi:hypothetical protein
MAHQSKSHSPADPQPDSELRHKHDDDLIVVPKGQSRFQFFVILGLFIFILVIFTVGPFFQAVVGGMFSGGGPDQSYFRWTHPETGVTTEMSYQSFMERKRALDVLKELRLYYPAAVRDGLDREADVTDADTAMWLILDQLAQEHGIAITSEDMLERVDSIYGSRIQYEQQKGFQGGFTDPLEYFKNEVSRAGLSVASVEIDLRSWMRAELYSALLKSTLSVADPAEIEKLWKDDEKNALYSFDYVALPAADFTEAARAELPSDEGLLEWLHSQPELVQKGFRTDDRVSVEVAWIPLDPEATGATPFDPAAIYEKYPVPPVWDESLQARKYYNMYSNVRFPAPPAAEEEKAPDETQAPPGEDSDKPAEDAPKEDAAKEGAAKEDDPAAEQTPTETPPQADPEKPEPEKKLYLTFEEAEPRARIEAGWKRALEAWLGDLQTRSHANETIDFRAEAEAFGLSYESSGEAQPREVLEKAAGWGGELAAGSLFFAQPKHFVQRPQVQEHSMVIGRQVDKVAGVERPIDEIRDRLKEAWVEDRAAQLALDKLETLRGTLGKPPPEGSEEVFLPTVDRETFTKAVEAAGFTVVQRPPLHRYSLPNDDFDHASPGDQYIRTSQTYFSLEEGQVPAPERNTTNTHAFLVRSAGKAAAPIEEMKPSELQNLRRQAASTASQAFEKRYLRADSPTVKSTYKIYLRSLDEEKKTQS